MLEGFELSFPDKKFNELLQKKFAILDSLTSEAIGIMSVGSGKGIIKSYSILVSTYNHLISEIDRFTPPGKSPEYLNSFKSSMKNLIKPLVAKVSDFKKEATKQIHSNKILSHNNKEILFGENFSPEFILRNTGVLMDKGGHR